MTTRTGLHRMHGLRRVWQRACSHALPDGVCGIATALEELRKVGEVGLQRRRTAKRGLTIIVENVRPARCARSKRGFKPPSVSPLTNLRHACPREYQLQEIGKARARDGGRGSRAGMPY